MKMTDILHRYYGDFDLVNEKWNEDYESILIKPKDNKDTLQSFGKKTKTTRIFLILIET